MPAPVRRLIPGCVAVPNFFNKDCAPKQFILLKLNHSKWQLAPPPFLVKLVESTATRFEQRKLRMLLERLSDQLRDAFSAMDVGLGRELRGRWEELVKKVDMPISDPIYERVTPP